LPADLDRILGCGRGRRREQRQIGEAARQRLRQARLGQFERAARPPSKRLLCENPIECSRHPRNAGAIVIDQSRKPARQIKVAQHPDHAIIISRGQRTVVGS
jgi:hypothetical protein